MNGTQMTATLAQQQIAMNVQKWTLMLCDALADNHITGKINYYNLASILEDLYVENAELKARVEALEKDKEEWYHPESSLAK